MGLESVRECERGRGRDEESRGERVRKETNQRSKGHTFE
jgi:hypothetical protein